ncbi:MAG: chalcone isomerase family protein [Candidatus Thiodiazotropha sp.]
MKSLPGIFGLSLLLCLVTLTVNARVSPLADYPSLHAVGSGELTWWGFRVYRATLYAPQGQYGANRPHALEIVYRMSISREQLASTSLKEIEKIRGEPLADREGVLDQFQQVFCDVSDGDSIVGLHLPGEGARFYAGSDYLGRIDDPELAAAFFDIWLSPATSKPELRSRLLGEGE